LASRSATASDNSAKAGSNVLSGNEAESPCTLLRAESRNEERDDGRRGVVGREREVDRARRWGVSLWAISRLV
jgi:formylglycine-generating enzyme required for sulfatase activity